MAATIEIRRLTGAGPTSTDVTSINTRVDAADAHTVAGMADPIIIPTSGSEYSVWCVLRPEVTVAPVTLVSNMKIWPGVDPSTMWTGDGTVQCKGNDASSYVQNTIPAIQLTTGNYATLSGAPVELSTLRATGLALTGTRATTGSWATMFVYQFVVTSLAVPGLTNVATLYFSYDET